VLHGALEKFFLRSNEKGELLERDVLIEAFNTTLYAMQVPAEYYDSIQRRGLEALVGYYDKYKDSFSVDVVVEKKIKAVPFELDDGEQILLTGAIDKMEMRDDRAVSVIDYKTGKPWSRLTKDKRESLKRQVVFYKLLLSSYNDGQYNMTEGTLDFIEPHPETHEFEREVVSVCDEDVRQLRKEINTFAKDILSGNFLDQDIKQKYGDKSLDEYIKLLNILKK
jgi:RecB family exonuclease